MRSMLPDAVDLLSSVKPDKLKSKRQHPLLRQEPRLVIFPIHSCIIKMETHSCENYQWKST
jgi:hypothetical protein